MNKKHVAALTKVNLRYANPQATNKARRSGKSGKRLSRYLIMQYLLSGGLFLLIYGFTLFFMDFSRLPGFFTYYVALFGIIAFSQGITSIYNVFFESQDLAGYLPLPIKQLEIFLAKIIVVVMTIVPFTIPIFIVFVLTGIRSGVFLPLALILAIVLFGLFLALIFSICSFIVFGLTRTTFFKKHKKLVTSLLLVVSMAIAILGILLINVDPTMMNLQTLDRGIIWFLLPFFYVSHAPFSLQGILSLLGMLVVVCGLAVLIKVLLLPKLYEQLLDASPGVTSGIRKYRETKNIQQLLARYNSYLIRDPNLMMQVFSSSILFPIIFIISFAIGSPIDLGFLTTRYVGFIFFIGILFALLSVNQMSFVANLISLDRDNFLFVRSLPMSMKKYLQIKFRFGCLLQLVINGVIVLSAGIAFHLPLVHLLSVFLGNLLGTYLLSLRYFVRDYRLLNLNWTNLSQLFTRGAGNLGMVAMMMGSLLIGIFLMIFYFIGTTFLSVWQLDVPLFLVLLAGTCACHYYYQRKFWQKL